MKIYNQFRETIQLQTSYSDHHWSHWTSRIPIFLIGAFILFFKYIYFFPSRIYYHHCHAFQTWIYYIFYCCFMKKKHLHHIYTHTHPSPRHTHTHTHTLTNRQFRPMIIIIIVNHDLMVRLFFV